MKYAEKAYISGIFVVVIVDGKEVEVGAALRGAGYWVIDPDDVIDEYGGDLTWLTPLNR